MTMEWILIISLLIVSNDGTPKNVEYSGSYSAYFSKKEDCEMAKKFFTYADYQRDGVFIVDMECERTKK